MSAFISIVIALLIVIAIIWALFAYFYHRSTREVSLIRTGIGGRRVIMDGGVIAIPYLHEISRVNMQTLRLEVRREGNQALITKDRMRVDIEAEFYLSVEPNENAIARASQTLGNRTFDADKLKDLIEGKFVDTLRSEAAKRTLDELHENRADFARALRENLDETLARNGLALESVSVSALDQTPFGALDENNAFNAVGMRKLAEVIANSKKERADIDNDADVAVHRAAMEASKRKLSIDLEQQAAEIRQSQELETLRASQIAEIAARKAESEQAANAARIRMEQEIRTADIGRERAVREAEIARQQALDTAEQQRKIDTAQKTQEESKALAAADLARAEAVKAAETITTARALAEAQRRKDVATLVARQESEISHERMLANAKAEAEASVERAKATLHNAKAEAEAAKLRIASLKEEMTARAAGQKALNEAENVLGEEIVALKNNIARLEALPKIIEQMVRPAEKIDSIKVHHFSGGFPGSKADGAASSGATSPVNAALDSILDMAVQLPALKKIGKILEDGIDDSIGSASPKPKKDGA